MPLTEIKREIEKEAEKEAKGMRDEANAEKDRMLKEAEAQAREIKAKYDAETEQELKGMEQELGANLELSNERVFLDAREDALQREVDGVKGELVKELRENPSLYRRIFANAVKEALEIAPARELTALANKEDAKYLEESNIRVEYQKVDGGLIIVSKAGNVRIDATLPTLVDLKSNEIKSAILESMFPEKAHGSAKKQKHQKAVKAGAKDEKAGKQTKLKRHHKESKAKAKPRKKR